MQDLAVSTGLASALPRVLCVPAGAFSAAECSAASTVPAQAREHVSACLMYSSWPVFSSAGCVTHYRPRHSSQGMHEFRLSLRTRHLTRKAVRFSAALVRGRTFPATLWFVLWVSSFFRKSLLWESVACSSHVEIMSQLKFSLRSKLTHLICAS